MPDRASLLLESAAVVRRPSQADIVVPYAGSLAASPRHAIEIADTMRAVATAIEHAYPLRGLVLDFQLTHVAITAAGSDDALEHWLAEHRLVRGLQDTIDLVHDSHLASGI